MASSKTLGTNQDEMEHWKQYLARNGCDPEDFLERRKHSCKERAAVIEGGCFSRGKRKDC